MQFRHATERAPEHLPGQKVVVGFQKGRQRFIQLRAQDDPGDLGLNAWIEADVDPGARELFQHVDQRRLIGLEPKAVAVETEI